MSSHESPIHEPDRPPKKRIQRRHGACEPCRTSKTKCDGRTPCGACRSERRRQCPCVYSEKAMKLQLVTAEMRLKAESDKRISDESYVLVSEDEAGQVPIHDVQDTAIQTSSADNGMEISSSRQPQDNTGLEAENDNAKMSIPLSVCAAVDEFKRLKQARGYSAQVVSRCNGFDVSEKSSKNQTSTSGNQSCTSTASTQPLPLSVDLSNDPDIVQALGARLDSVDNLVSEGYLGQAWSDLGSIVREAQLVLGTASHDQPSEMSDTSKQLWNNILDLEAHLGLSIGRPTSLIVTKPNQCAASDKPVSLESSLEDTRIDLYCHIQGILGLNLFSSTAIRDFLERARDVFQHEPFHQIGLCTTKENSAAVQDLHLSTHLLYMVIFCRLAGLCDLFSRDLTNASWSDTPAAAIIREMSLNQPRQKLAYCRKMFRSAGFILDAFVILHKNRKEPSGRYWIRCHSAYLAAVILGIAKLRHEVEWHATTNKLKNLERIFSNLHDANPDCHLYHTALNRLQDLNSVKEPASEAARHKHNGIKNRKQIASASEHSSPKAKSHPTAGGPSAFSSVSPTAVAKRTIDMVNENDDIPMTRDHFTADYVRGEDSYQPPATASSGFETLGNLDHLSFFQDNSATIYSQSSSNYSNSNQSVPSSATSFTESEISMPAAAEIDVTHPGPPFAYPFPYNVFHPPMAWNNPAYNMNNQTGAPLPVPIPIMAHFAPDASPVACEVRSQYSLSSASNSKALSANSHLSSPLMTPSEGTVVSTRLSPATQSEQSYKNSNTAPAVAGGSNASGQPFIQQIERPLLGASLSSRSRRSSLKQGLPANTVRQSPGIAQNNQHMSAMAWNPAISGSSNIQHLSAANIPVAEMRRRQNVADIAASELRHHGHGQVSGYHHPPHPPSQVINGQLFSPDQIAYMNSADGMFESPQISGHYAHGHLQQYAKYYMSDPTQFHEQQWRQVPIDAAATSSNQY